MKEVFMQALQTANDISFKNICPVLTVGPHVAALPYKDFTVDYILFPTDLGPHAEFAATYALSFAREKHARLTFMHVVSLDEAFQRDRAELVAAARTKLEEENRLSAEDWLSGELSQDADRPKSLKAKSASGTGRYRSEG
jgi:Universal stress protein family